MDIYILLLGIYVGIVIVSWFFCLRPLK